MSSDMEIDELGATTRLEDKKPGRELMRVERAFIQTAIGESAYTPVERRNLFRNVVLPSEDANRNRLWILLGAVGLVLVGSAVSLPESAAVLAGAILIAAVLAWALFLRTNTFSVSAAPPQALVDFDRQVVHLTEAGTLGSLGLDLEEEDDVLVFVVLRAFSVDDIPDVCLSDGRLRRTDSSSPARVTTSGEDYYARSVNYFLAANRAGLAMGIVDADFFEDRSHLETNRWMWRNVENLRVTEVGVMIELTSGRDVAILLDTKRSGQATRAGTPPPPRAAPTAPPPPGPPQPNSYAAADGTRNRAQEFVNSVNVLRSEWEHSQ